MSAADLTPLLAATATAFIALLFARAAWHKLTDFTAFTGFVADYRIVPELLVQPVSAAIVAAEIASVVLLMVPPLHMLGALLAIALLLAYGAGMATNIMRGRDRIECGCGGAAQPLGWQLVVRNLVLAAVAGLGLAAAPFALTAGEAVTALVGGFTLWAGFVLSEQILANFAHARLRR